MTDKTWYARYRYDSITWWLQLWSVAVERANKADLPVYAMQYERQQLNIEMTEYDRYINQEVIL